MRFSASTVLAFVAAAAAQGMSESNGSNPFNIPPEGLNTEAGDSVDLTWKPTTQGTVTIYLRSGASNDLNKGEAIASNIQNSGSFTWNVPDDIVRGSNYALEIVDDDDEQNTNYTPPFVVESDNNTAPSSASSASASMTATDSAMSTGTSTGSMTETDSAMSSMTDMSSATSTGTSSATATDSSSSSDSSATSSMATSTRCSSSSTSSSNSDAQATSSPSEGAASRLTTLGGLMGLVAVGAIAL